MRDIKDLGAAIAYANYISRRTGQTTALVEAVIKAGGILIVGNFSQKEMIHNNFKLPLAQISSLAEGDTFLRGIAPTPIFFDSTAIEVLSSVMINAPDEIDGAELLVGNKKYRINLSVPRGY